MRIEFLEPKKIFAAASEPRITLLANKKLSFNRNIQYRHNLTRDTYLKVGLNTDDPDDKSIYLMKTNKKDTKARKIQKSGTQLLFPVKFALQRLGIDDKQLESVTEVEELKINRKDIIRIKFRVKD